MSGSPAYISNLKKLSHAAPTLAEIDVIEQELYQNPSDRAAVVLFGALLESALEGYLVSKTRSDLGKSHLDSLFTANSGLLGTFGAKIMVAYGFAFVGPMTRHDLDLVRRLRDVFAHARRPIGFDTEEIAEACRHFQFIDLPTVHVPYRSHEMTSADNLAAAVDKQNPKTRFITTCDVIARRMASAYRPQEGMLAWMEPLP